MRLRLTGSPRVCADCPPVTNAFSLADQIRTIRRNTNACVPPEGVRCCSRLESSRRVTGGTLTQAIARACLLSLENL